MSSFDASRWADAVIGTAGGNAGDTVAALEDIASAVACAGQTAKTFSGEVAASRMMNAARRLAGLSSGEETALRFAVMLTRRGHLPRISTVAAEARALLAERAGIVRVKVETTVPLDESARESLRAALKRRTGAVAVELDEHIDPNLLGGMRIGIGWQRIDGSLRRRLDSLAVATGAARRGGGS